MGLRVGLHRRKDIISQSCSYISALCTNPQPPSESPSLSKTGWLRPNCPWAWSCFVITPRPCPSSSSLTVEMTTPWCLCLNTNTDKSFLDLLCSRGLPTQPSRHHHIHALDFFSSSQPPNNLKAIYKEAHDNRVLVPNHCLSSVKYLFSQYQYPKWR